MNVKVIKIIAIVGVFAFASYNMYQFYLERKEAKIVEVQKLEAERVAKAEQVKLQSQEQARKKAEKERLAQEKVEAEKRVEAQRLAKSEEEKRLKELEQQERQLKIDKEREELAQKREQREQEKKELRLAEKIAYARKIDNFDWLSDEFISGIKSSTPAYIRHNKQDLLDYQFKFSPYGKPKLLSASANPLHLYAMVGDRADVVQVLIEIGFDINSVTKEGVTPLHFASAFNSAEMVDILVGEGADLGAKDFLKEYNTLHIASAYNPRPEVVETLVKKHGMDIDMQVQGYSPILLASIHNHNFQTIEKLMDLGADVSIIDSEGKDVSMHLQRKIKSGRFEYRQISREYDEELLNNLILHDARN